MLSNKSTLVSVIVPIYNSERYLYNCLKSICNQSYKNIEIILIDDGSTDKSYVICKEFAKRDERIRLFHNDNNGVSYSRNKGIEFSTGSRICFIDSDDTIEEDYILKLVEPLKLKDYDLVICGINDIIVEKDILTMRELPSNLSGVLKIDFWALFKVPILSGPVCKLYSSKIIKTYNIRFDENISYSEDLLFNIKYLKHTFSYKIVSYSNYNYYHREICSLSKLTTYKSFEGALIVCKELKDFLAEYKIDKAEYILSYLCINYIYWFSELRNDEQGLVGFKKRVNCFKSIWKGMYAAEEFRRKVIILLLKYNLTTFLYISFRIRKYIRTLSSK